MIFTIKYTDAKTGEQKEFAVEAAQDVFAIEIPVQESERIPALKIDVNSDAIRVETASGVLLGFDQYTDYIADSIGDGAFEGHGEDWLLTSQYDLTKLDREQCVELLERASIQCYDTETVEELREAVRANVADNTIDFHDLP